MPTILRIDGYNVRIYSDDHGEPHVHVVKAGSMAKIIIRGQRSVRNTGLSERELRRAKEIVADNEIELLEAWNAIHQDSDES